MEGRDGGTQRQQYVEMEKRMKPPPHPSPAGWTALGPVPPRELERTTRVQPARGDARCSAAQAQHSENHLCMYVVYAQHAQPAAAGGKRSRYLCRTYIHGAPAGVRSRRRVDVHRPYVCSSHGAPSSSFTYIRNSLFLPQPGALPTSVVVGEQSPRSA